jgi:hypothetical protein
MQFRAKIQLRADLQEDDDADKRMSSAVFATVS